MFKLGYIRIGYFMKNTLNPVKAKAVLYTSKTLSDGSHPVMVRITKDRKPSYIGLGYSLNPAHWDLDSSKAWESKPRITQELKSKLDPGSFQALKVKLSNIEVHPQAKVINLAIEEALATVTFEKRTMEADNVAITSKIIKARLQPTIRKESPQSYLVYFKTYTDTLFATGKFGTWNRYDNAVKKLERFLKGQDLLFDALTPEFLNAFEYELQRSGLLSTSVESITKTLKATFTRALKDSRVNGFIKINPFSIYTVKKGTPRNPERLTKEEIETIEKLELESDSRIWHVRNFFLFSYYCAGIRVGDLLQLKWSNISEDGRLYYSMDKTEKEHSIKLLAQALRILGLYKHRLRPDEYIFPFLQSVPMEPWKLKQQLDSKTAMINKDLKIIARRAKISKKVTSHVSRHSFADNARRKEISVYDLKQLLNHSSISITERYLATLDNDSSDTALDKIYNG